NVNAWQAMSKKYGKLEWAALFQTAISTAEKGFPVSERLAFFIGRAFDSFPVHAQEFYGKNGRPLEEGGILVQKDLAHSLQLISEQGARVFYGGELGQRVHAEMQRTGSFLTLDDLIADKAEWWEPISIDYKGYRVYTASPPATAFPSLIRLGMMSRFDSEKLEHNSADYLHLFAEVSKHAFWCRLRYAGDPEIHPPPLDTLLSEEYWQQQVNRISREHATEFKPPGVIAVSSKNTTHFVVADKWGNIVSATQTLGNIFGSRIMPKGTGIWLNNSLAYCTFEPKGNPMDAIAGQRKLSGDCPTIITKDGKPWVALGTPGGHTIGQTVPQMVLNLIDFDMDILQAISAPRISFLEPNTLWLENDVPDEVAAKLMEMGHEVDRSRGLGVAHALSLEYDEDGNPVRFAGAADPRGDGKAKGF
ncbi:MAG: gamma-glutamyltransferase family protein, partial [bacterium]